MTKTVSAIRHVHFEDLGCFEKPLTDAGFTIRYCDMGLDHLPARPQPDLLAVLGGPISAYEDDLYPFLADEIDMLAARLATGKPVLGICLGAQLMARALGAQVYPGRAKEIGWIPLTLTREGREGLLSSYENQPVLHWHGDTFDLPKGAMNLAATRDCDHQAFAYGRHALAFQFHPEASEKGFERWLVGHAGEIAATPGVLVAGLRAGMREHGARSMERGRACFTRWLASLW